MSIKKEVKYLNEILQKNSMTPLSEQTIHELIINKKKLPKQIQEGIRKTISSILGIPVLGLVGWVWYRLIRATMDQATRKCGILGINTTRRQNCMSLAKIESLENSKNFINSSQLASEKKKKILNKINMKIEKLREKILHNNPTKISTPSPSTNMM